MNALDFVCNHCTVSCKFVIESLCMCFNTNFLLLLVLLNVPKLCAHIMSGEEPPESLFMKELRRRGMTPTSLLEEKNRSPNRDEEIRFREEDGGWRYSRRNDVTTDAETNLTNQRETSMALNSEGLEVGRFQFLFIVISYLFPFDMYSVD